MDVPQFEYLVVRFLSGAASEEEEMLLYSLLQERSYYSVYERNVGAWMENMSGVEGSDFDADGAFSRLQKLSSDIDSKKRSPQIRYFLRYAAVAAIILAVSLTWFLWPTSSVTTQSVAVARHELVVPRGSQCEFLLPDGTHVWINSGSKLSYLSDYDDTARYVSLEGEAYFEVAPNAQKPFVVSAGDLSIKALGTAFNVFTFNGMVTTSLVEGCVEVKNSIDASPAVTLLPGHEVVYDNKNGGIELSSVQTDLMCSWRHKKWVVKSMPLPEFIERLQRRYDATISIMNPQLFKAKVTGSFVNEDIDQILSGIEAAFQLKIERNGADYLLY